MGGLIGRSKAESATIWEVELGDRKFDTKRSSISFGAVVEGQRRLQPVPEQCIEIEKAVKVVNAGPGDRETCTPRGLHR